MGWTRSFTFLILTVLVECPWILLNPPVDDVKKENIRKVFV